MNTLANYLLLNEGKWEVKTKEQFFMVATDDTRLKGTSLNLSLDNLKVFIFMLLNLLFLII
jgi:hypothetical protein